MFQNYVDAKAEKRRGWMSIFVAISVAVHVIGIALLLIRSFWVISPLEPPDIQITLAAPPPPPPPPPPASETPERTPDVVVREVDTTVQPDPEREIPEDAVTEEFAGIEGGIEGGVEGGSLGGVQGGVVGGGAPPPPAPPSEPKVVRPEDLTRVSGNPNIHPDARTQTRIDRDGRSVVTARVKMCLTASGAVESVNVSQSSGYSAYDNQILSEMRTWRYQAEGAPVCTTITFNYRQQHR